MVGRQWEGEWMLLFTMVPIVCTAMNSHLTHDSWWWPLNPLANIKWKRLCWILWFPCSTTKWRILLRCLLVYICKELVENQCAFRCQREIPGDLLKLSISSVFCIADIAISMHSQVVEIERRIHDVVGIPHDFGEAIYVLFYGTSEKYAPHHDHCKHEVGSNWMGFDTWYWIEQNVAGSCLYPNLQIQNRWWYRSFL